MISIEALHETIIGLMVPNSAHTPKRDVSELSPEDWRYVLDCGREHRFLPLLHWALRQSGTFSHIPTEIQKTLADISNRHTLRALTVQRELLLLNQLLDHANIAHVFLKGAYLAQFAYPHPALRPVRDLDVVIQPSQIKYAQDLLITKGYSPTKNAPGMVEAYAEQAKHLPGLRSPSRHITVELHVHVDAPGGVLTGMDAFKNVRTQRLANADLPFMDPTDLLIHLCVHAVSFHNFNNGPLIIADIGFLLQTCSLSGDQIQQRADELGVAKPVALALALTESAWSTRRNDLPILIENVPQSLISAARQMCFTPLKQQQNMSFLADLALSPGVANTGQKLLHKLIPPKDKIALEFGTPRTRLELGTFYTRRFWRIATERIPALYSSRKQSSHQSEYQRTLSLKQWLDSSN